MLGNWSKRHDIVRKLKWIEDRWTTLAQKEQRAKTVDVVNCRKCGISLWLLAVSNLVPIYFLPFRISALDWYQGGRIQSIYHRPLAHPSLARMMCYGWQPYKNIWKRAREISWSQQTFNWCKREKRYLEDLQQNTSATKAELLSHWYLDVNKFFRFHLICVYTAKQRGKLLSVIIWPHIRYSYENYPILWKVMAGESGVEEVIKEKCCKEGNTRKDQRLPETNFSIPALPSYRNHLTIGPWVCYSIVSHPYKTWLSLDVLSYFSVATNQRF